MVALSAAASAAFSQTVLSSNPYRVLKTAQTMGTGGIDYVHADNENRRLYVPRGNQVLVFDLDSLNYVDIEDKDNIAVVDVKTLKVTAHYDLAGKGSGAGMLDILVVGR